MDIADLERRVRELEISLERGRKVRAEHKKRVEIGRRVYRGFLPRIIALVIAYPLVSLFYLWIVQIPEPWLRGLTPIVTIGIFVLVTPYVQRALFKHYSKEDKRDEEGNIL